MPLKLLFFAILSALAMCIHAGDAQAQTQTYVADYGDDANLCTRTAPCQSLSRAVDLAVKQVTVLTPGDYIAFTLQKSITVYAPHADTIISGGLTISQPGIRVVFRGVQFSTLSATPLNFAAGASLVLENVTINSDNGGGILITADNSATTLKNVTVHYGGGAGISVHGAGPKRITIENSLLDFNLRGITVQGSGNAQVSISDTTISNAVGEGIFINPNGGATRLVIQNSKVVNNGGTGVLISPFGNAKVNTAIEGSGIDGNVIGIRSFPANPAVSNLSISDTSTSNNVGGVHASGRSVVGIIRGNISGNSSYGIGAVSPAAVRVGSSMVNGNALGFSGPISSYGNNQLHGNGAPGASTPLPPGSVP